jgi:hypothetical protein
MADLIMPRRKFLTGLLGLVAAPAVVKASSLMPVKVVTASELYTFPNRVWVPPSSGINLAQLRELLRPGVEKMIDEMYAEHPGQWKSIFAGEADG